MFADRLNRISRRIEGAARYSNARHIPIGGSLVFRQ